MQVLELSEQIKPIEESHSFIEPEHDDAYFLLFSSKKILKVKKS